MGMMHQRRRKPITCGSVNRAHLPLLECDFVACRYGRDATQLLCIVVFFILVTCGAVVLMFLCDLQVYQSDSGQLMFMNKYHGRKLTLAGFKEALYQFFHNGRCLRRELLSPVLRRLREMQAALEACESYRFYSSSLLIIYDGDPPRTPTRPRHRGGEEGDEDEPSDEEDEEEEGAFGFPRSSSAGGSASVAGGSSNSGSSRSPHSPGEASSPVVDVRMIDFAHTTCRHYGEDSVVHEGQDSGFIFGLQNLITIISQVEDHSTDWEDWSQHDLNFKHGKSS